MRKLLWIVAIAAVLLAACASQPPREGAQAGTWASARQMVLVTTADWAAQRGQLQRYARDGDEAPWQAIGAPVEVTVGRTGTAWGSGLHPAQAGGPHKREGDGKAPAGVFAIGTAFGYAANPGTAMPYRAMQAQDWCIDVNASPLYNRIVNTAEVGEAAIAGSTEPMRRDLHENGDQRYRLGFVIEHNPGNVPGGGSCIFAHVWDGPGVPTAGCTAMPDAAIGDVLAWLQPQARPVFVLLPRAERQRLQAAWSLPN